MSRLNLASRSDLVEGQSLYLIDSHAHLDFVDNIDAVLERAKKAGVARIVTIGTSVECSQKCIEIAEKYSDDNLQIFATCGMHPEDGKADLEKYGSITKTIEELLKLTKTSARVVGIGECGLDYYAEAGSQKKPVTSKEDRKFQKALFEAQIKLASDLRLPLVVHCRNAWADTFELISTSRSDLVEGQTFYKPTGVFHSWTGDWQAAQKAVDLGFYISFSGIVTFKNAPLIQAVAKKIQIGRILLETDSPFLAPHPKRGQKNEPENVKIVAGFLAEIRKTNIAAISENTSRNAHNIFKMW